MRWVCIALLLGACKSPRTASTGASKPPLVREEVTSPLDQVHALLLGREETGCPDRAMLGFEPEPHFVRLAETVQMPPWVSIRSAQCVMEHPSDGVTPALVGWVSESKWAGLGRVVLAELDAVSELGALTIGEAALNGPLRVHAVDRLVASKYSSVRALVPSYQTP